LLPPPARSAAEVGRAEDRKRIDGVLMPVFAVLTGILLAATVIALGLQRARPSDAPQVTGEGVDASPTFVAARVWAPDGDPVAVAASHAAAPLPPRASARSSQPELRSSPRPPPAPESPAARDIAPGSHTSVAPPTPTPPPPPPVASRRVALPANPY
jgi:hypothetical protein